MGNVLKNKEREEYVNKNKEQLKKISLKANDVKALEQENIAIGMFSPELLKVIDDAIVDSFRNAYKNGELGDYNIIDGDIQYRGFEFSISESLQDQQQDQGNEATLRTDNLTSRGQDLSNLSITENERKDSKQASKKIASQTKKGNNPNDVAPEFKVRGKDVFPDDSEDFKIVGSKIYRKGGKVENNPDVTYEFVTPKPKKPLTNFLKTISGRGNDASSTTGRARSKSPKRAAKKTLNKKGKGIT